jgi:SAM-dependent methyltransferase
MKKEVLVKNLKNPVSRLAISREICRGKKVLDIGCVNHDIANVEAKSWLHGALREVSADILGVDYLESETRELASRGFRVVAADITKPLEIHERFDVIVVGHLIEHLSSFEGLMNNIRNLLGPGGCVLISSPNPFYREQYFYSAFKNDIIVNPEHTCWLDPVTLDQLARRFGLLTTDVYWIQEKWQLGQVILNGGSRSFDIFTGTWDLAGPRSKPERLISWALDLAFRCFVKSATRRRLLAKYDKRTLSRTLYLRSVSALFAYFWNVYKRVIVSSPINRHEVFLSVLRCV